MKNVSENWVNGLQLFCSSICLCVYMCVFACAAESWRGGKPLICEFALVISKVLVSCTYTAHQGIWLDKKNEGKIWIERSSLDVAVSSLIDNASLAKNGKFSLISKTCWMHCPKHHLSFCIG